MIAKQQFYLECSQDNFDVVSFCRQHRSVQWRKVGKANYQVKFNDHEAWIDVSSFRENYRNKVMKDLADRVSQSSNILSQQDILMCVPPEIRKWFADYVIETKRSRNELATAEDYNSLVHEYNALTEKVESLKQQLVQSNEAKQAAESAARKAEKQAENKVKSISHRIDESMSITGLSKSSWTRIKEEFDIR